MKKFVRFVIAIIPQRDVMPGLAIRIPAEKRIIGKKSVSKSAVGMG
jgi:hypothetical protein